MSFQSIEIVIIANAQVIEFRSTYAILEYAILMTQHLRFPQQEPGGQILKGTTEHDICCFLQSITYIRKIQLRNRSASNVRVS
jgi:hypothetical protein